MKTIYLTTIGLALFGAMGLVLEVQAAEQQSQNPNNQETEDEIQQKSIWRKFIGDNIEITIGEPPAAPQQHLPGPNPQPFPGYPGPHYIGIANELEFIEHLWSENDMVDEYKKLAKRPYLSEADQILFVQSAYSNLDFDRNITEVLIALIVNPCFSEGARDAILDGLNQGKIWDSNRRKKIFDVLESRGAPLPSPRDPQRWIGYHFSIFQRAINELSTQYVELERRVLILDKKIHQLEEFDRRILALEKRPMPPTFDFSGFDKRLGAVEKRNLPADEFNKRISVLEGRISAPAEFERRISALEKAVQTRGGAGGAQPAQVAELQKQIAALEAKVKQLEAEVKRPTTKPRTPERAPAPDKTPDAG